MPLMSLRGLDPLDSLSALQSDLQSLFGNPLAGFNLGPAASSVFPPVNVFADAQGAIVVRAEVPGIAPEDVQIEVEPRRLSISGERKPAQTSGGLHRRERQAGRFSRMIQLPEDLDGAAATATCRNGVLTVRIPHRAEVKARKIPVSDG